MLPFATTYRTDFLLTPFCLPSNACVHTQIFPILMNLQTQDKFTFIARWFETLTHHSNQMPFYWKNKLKMLIKIILTFEQSSNTSVDSIDLSNNPITSCHVDIEPRWWCKWRSGFNMDEHWKGAISPLISLDSVYHHPRMSFRF